MCSRVASRIRSEAEQGAIGQVEGPLGFLLPLPPGLGLAPRFGERAEVHHREGHRQARGDDLHRLAIGRDERGSQDLVASDDLVDDPLQSGAASRVPTTRTAIGML